GPVELHRIWPLGQDLAHRETVLDLLEHEAREHGQDLEPDVVAEFVDALEEPRIGEPVVLALRAYALVSIRGAGAVVGPVDGVARVVPAIGADEHASALRQPSDPKGAEERVEQARVVRVLDVLDVELPVVRQHLHEAAEHADGPAQHTRHAPEDLVSQIGLERRRVGTQAREDQTGKRRRPELAGAVRGLGETSRHAATAIGALLEGYAGERALEIVRPCVVDALEVLRATLIVQRDERAAMRATVLEGPDPAVLRADDDDRHLADERRPEVARSRQVGLEAHEAPRGALEDAAQLGAVVRLVLVEPVRDAG